MRKVFVPVVTEKYIFLGQPIYHFNIKSSSSYVICDKVYVGIVCCKKMWQFDKLLVDIFFMIDYSNVQDFFSGIMLLLHDIISIV